MLRDDGASGAHQMNSKLAIIIFGFSVGVILVIAFFPSSKPQLAGSGRIIPVIDKAATPSPADAVAK
jgi:hypothetical protein